MDGFDLDQSDAAVADKPILCVKCGYDLRGLPPTTEKCPECGTPRRQKRAARFVDNLTDAKTSYLRTLQGGFAAMVLGLLGSVAWSMFVEARSNTISPVAVWLAESVGAALLLLWTGGVVLTTLQRPLGEHTVSDPVLDHPRIRPVIWGLLALPLLTAATLLAAGLAGSVVLAIAGAVLMVLSLFGQIPMCIYYGSLADWAGDSGLGGRFRNCAWLTAVCGTVLVVGYVLMLIPGLPARILVIMAMVIAGLGVLAGGLLFVLGIIQLFNTANWAIRNKGQAREREIRIATRQAEEDERRAAAAALAAETGVAVPTSEGSVYSHYEEKPYDPDEDLVPLVGDPESDQSDLPTDADSKDGAGTQKEVPKPKGIHVYERQDDVEPLTLEVEDGVEPEEGRRT